MDKCILGFMQMYSILPAAWALVGFGIRDLWGTNPVQSGKAGCPCGTASGKVRPKTLTDVLTEEPLVLVLK